MNYRDQHSTAKLLMRRSTLALEVLRNKGRGELARLWNTYRGRIATAIAMCYRQSTQGKNWTHSDFNRVKFRLAAEIRSLIQQFHADSIRLVKNTVNDVYGQSILRHAWILDQVTPENIKIRLPARRVLREAEFSEDTSAFEARWSSWLDAYNSALVHNLTLNAMNEGSLTDAMDEVDATKANTPAYTLIDALNRVYEFEVMDAVNRGAEQIGAINENAVEEEVWRTREDLRVCDDCDGNDGQTVETVGYPPMHPNCHCFTEIVPASFADLLRSGDSADWELAQQMEREGIVPNALVIRGENDEIAGRAIVDFEQWQRGEGLSVSGR